MMQVIHEKNHLKRRSHRLRRAWGPYGAVVSVLQPEHMEGTNMPEHVTLIRGQAGQHYHHSLH